MKLIDPSDDALNEAFAVYVAGWTRQEVSKSERKQKSHHLITPDGGGYCVVWKDGKMGGDVPRFTTSADAVLPWLEKWEYVDISRDADYEDGPWGVAISAKREQTQLFIGSASTLPRACVIALLRAHGVEIEFTK